MTEHDQRALRANTIRYLEAVGAIEGRDWRFADSTEAWDRPGVVDNGNVVEVIERLTPKNPAALPILVRSGAVRMIGGPLLAKAMDEGVFPAEMPFVTAAPWSRS